MRRPTTERSAGTRVRATATEAAMTTIPPIPMDRSIDSSKIRRPASPRAVVMPENRMALPAMPTVRATLSSTLCLSSSSRKRLTNEQGVVDGGADA